MRFPKLFAVCFCVILLSTTIVSRAQPATPATATAGLRLLRSMNQGVDLELATPTYQMTPESLPDGMFQRLTIPGAALTTDPGKPQLPRLTAVLGVPANAQIQLQILDDSPATLSATIPMPAPRPAPLTDDLQPAMQPAAPDPNVYRGTAAYPAQFVRIAEDAWMRDQRIVRIEAYPFQYDPAKKAVTWRQRLRVAVRWTTADAQPYRTQQTRPNQPDPFEPVFQQTLLNYETAKPWRVQRSASPANRPSYAATFSATATQPRYKIVVDRDGLYRISYADLQAAGLDVAAVDPRTFRLTSQGNDVAIAVAGESDGRFDPGDTITFYGQKFAGGTIRDSVIIDGQLVTADTISSQSYSAPTTYTDENVYWLDVNGAPGPRIITLDGAPGDQTPSPTFYRTTVRAEQSNLWWTFHFTNRDTWFWDRLQTSSSITGTYATNLSALATEPFTATIRGEVVARASDPSVNPDHRTRILLNDPANVLEDVAWDGATRRRFEVQAPQSLLREGTNQLLFNVIKPNLVGYDDIYFDWFEIEYARRFEAAQDQLAFSGDNAGRWKYNLSGFSSPQITVYNITDPLTPQQIVNAAATSGSSGNGLAFDAEHAANAQFLAVAPSAVQRPKRITSYTPGNLRSTARGADYIFIAPRDFVTATQQLASYRAAQGMRTLVVDVDDVYNEFNDGIYSPVAIKKFLAYAYANWQAPAPSYVLLVGDGNWNFKGFNIPRYGAPPIYMPPNLAWVDPWQGEVDSANLLATIVGNDVLPDLAIGRLPVNSVDELNAVITKIIGYESGKAADWQGRMLFVADNGPDEAGDFAALSDGVIADTVPSRFAVDRLYMNDYCPRDPQNPSAPCPTATNQLINTLNTTGTLLLSYTGHASIGRWAHEQLLVNSNIAQLQNGDRLPIVLSMTCLDGYWIYPNQPSLAEDLVRTPGRGAIATFSPTGLGVATGHDPLQRGFYSAVLQNGVRRLGPATLAAKLALYATGNNYDLIDTFTIFGDPALQILVPWAATIYLPAIQQTP